MICPTCGSTIRDGSTFCSNCGSPIAAAPTATPAQPAAPAAGAAVSAAAAGAAAPAAATGAAPVPPAQATTPAADPNAQLQQQLQQQWAAQQQNPYQQQGQQNPYQQQPQPAVQQKVYAQTTGISRALAMSTYWGLLPLIFAAVVGNKDNDPFLRHHLNQALVIFIGYIISGVLSFIIIGGILAIFLLVVSIIGTVQAYHSELTELPLIGKIKILK